MNSMFGNRQSIPLRALTDFSSLEPHVKKHLKNVYASLTISILTATAGSLFSLMLFQAYQHSWLMSLSMLLAVIASAGFGLALAFTSDTGKNRMTRLGYLLAIATSTGYVLGPSLWYTIQLNPSIIFTALTGTSMIFVSFTLSSLFAQKRTILYVSSVLMSLCTLSVMTFITSFFIRSYFLYQAQIYLGLVIMCLFVIYDTQLIVHRCRQGDRDYIIHAVMLFFDFVGIFRRLLQILSQMEERKKRR